MTLNMKLTPAAIALPAIGKMSEPISKTLPIGQNRMMNMLPINLAGQ